MTIVASNSLTVSNVNDGTITHTAYANSADGTDGFTTVYPNLNLLKNTKSQSYTSTGTANNNSSNNYPLDGVIADILNKPLTITYNYAITNSSGTWSGTIRPTYGLGGTNQSVSNINLSGTHKETVTLAGVGQNSYGILTSGLPAGTKVTITNLKVELGSTATPHMPSASEATTADWPSFIGQYSDFTQSGSTNPSDYTWSLIRGNDGKDGKDGKNGTNGKDGDPGKVVSDTEPTTRFKGLTWKYSGASDLTASDGTVIKPNTEYYYNGTHWVINYFSVNNFAAESITSDKIDGKNLTITDGEFVSTTTNGPVITSTEIKDNHIAISKTDGTVNTRNDIALDSEQGLAQKFTNITTGFYRTAGINYQGPFTSDSDGNYAQLTPQGTKLSTDVPWTNITRSSGVGTSGTLRARINNGVFYAQSKDVTIPSIEPNFVITIGTMPSIFSGVSGFDALGLLYSTGHLNVASVTVEDGKIRIGNPNSTIMSGKVIQFSINIPLG